MQLNLYANLDLIQRKTRRQIDSFLVNAPDKYKVFTIPKRGLGERIIAQPTKELKDFQRNVISVLETVFDIHPSATAYRYGIGIKHNAELHRKNAYLLKMDFSDFFNSITPDLLFLAISKTQINLLDTEKRVLTKSLFWNKAKNQSGRLSLSVGAPSSPFVSNMVMRDFDNEFSRLCESKDITYSRYADDLTFSANKKGVLFFLPDEVRRFLFKNYANAITINERKTVFTSKAHNRHVTGVTLTNQDRLSVGRDRKRIISSLIHKYTLSLLDTDTVYHLQGLFSFAIHIEPDFKNKMEKKYTAGVICEILKARKKNG